MEITDNSKECPTFSLMYELPTSDAQSILEIPATEKQNNNAEHIAIIIIYRGVNLNEATSAEIMQTYKKLLKFFMAQSNGSTLNSS